MHKGLTRLNKMLEKNDKMPEGTNRIQNQNINRMAKHNNEQAKANNKLEGPGDNEKEPGAKLRECGTTCPPPSLPIYQAAAEMSDPLRLSDGIDPTFTEWEALIKTKFLVNANRYSTKKARMQYLFDRTTGEAKSHLKRRCRTKRFYSAEDIIEHLATIYSDPSRAQRELNLNDELSSSIEKDLDAMALGQSRADNDRRVHLDLERNPYNEIFLCDIVLCPLCGEPGHNWEDTCL